MLRMRQTAKAWYPATAAPTHTARLSPGPPSPPARPPAEAVVAAAIWGSVIWRSFVTCDAADARVALRHPPSRVRTRERAEMKNTCVKLRVTRKGVSAWCERE